MIKQITNTISFSGTPKFETLTTQEFPITAFIIRGLRKQAIAEAAVNIMEPPKYMYVVLILSLTYSGHILKKDHINKTYLK